MKYKELLFQVVKRKLFSVTECECVKTRFHYERGKEHSLSLLLIFD